MGRGEWHPRDRLRREMDRPCTPGACSRKAEAAAQCSGGGEGRSGHCRLWIALRCSVRHVGRRDAPWGPGGPWHWTPLPPSAVHIRCLTFRGAGGGGTGCARHPRHPSRRAMPTCSTRRDGVIGPHAHRITGVRVVDDRRHVEGWSIWASCTRNRSEACGGRPGCGGEWAAKAIKQPPQQPAQPPCANCWAPQTRQRHQQEHRPQRPSERSDPTQHAKGRAGDCPGPRKETATRRNFTRGGGGGGALDPLCGVETGLPSNAWVLGTAPRFEAFCSGIGKH